MVDERRDNLALFYDFGADDWLLLLSTLLHDIGKFWQRTEDKAVEKNVRGMRREAAMKVVGIIGNIRKGGNTVTLVERPLASGELRAEVSL